MATRNLVKNGDRKCKRKIWLFFRIILVLGIPLISAYWVGNLLGFSLKFNPLLQDKVFILLWKDSNYNIFNEVFKFDILRYRTTLANNVKATIGGDNKDYEHEVEIFLKYNNLEESEIKINYGETKLILDQKEKSETISKIKELVYRSNINLKPEVLLDNKIITPNKKVGGYIEVMGKLTTKSWFILYFLSLLATITMIKLIKEIYQFIFNGKEYFK